MLHQMILNVLLETLEIVINDKTFRSSDFDTVYFDNATSSPKSRMFESFCCSLKLNKLNNIYNDNNKLLDLILTNNNCNMDVKRNPLPLVPVDSYHTAISIDVTLFIEDIPKVFPTFYNPQYSFRKANFNKQYEDLI